ncbi:MAG: hypothetical protein GY787_25700 [Alteromonadales bacterium]|nr:hypothetical protein [Alteromonadales bacterium]
MKVLCAICSLFICLSVHGIPKESVNSLFEPTLLLSQGRFKQASERYHTQSIIVLTQGSVFGTKEVWKLAGLLEGVAAIAAEKNADPVAYEYWANSVKYFLLGGSSWSLYQRQLHGKYQQINTLLQSSMGQSNAGPMLDNAWLQEFTIMEVWDKRLNLFSYSSPKPGLTATVTEANAIGPSNKDVSDYQPYDPRVSLSFDDGFKASRGVAAKPESVISSPILSSTNESQHVDNKTTDFDEEIIIGDSAPIDKPLIQEIDLSNHEVDIQEDEAKVSLPIHRVNIGLKKIEETGFKQRRAFIPMELIK